MSRTFLPCGLLLCFAAWCLAAESNRKPAADSIGALKAAGAEVKTDHRGGVTEITLSAKQGDEALAHAARLTTLRRLNATGSKVTGQGLRHLRAMARLEELWLAGTQVDDAGLVHLEALTGLRKLSLASTRTSDAGLRHVLGLGDLTHLYLDNTAVTMAGLERLGELKKLKILSLGSVKIGPEGRELLRGRSSRPTVFPLDVDNTFPLDVDNTFPLDVDNTFPLDVDDTSADAAPVRVGSDEHKLQGTWQATEVRAEGRAVAKEEIARTSITFRGTKGDRLL